MRIALANLTYPSGLEDSVSRATSAIADAGAAGARAVCFPECYVPGYRGLGHAPPHSTSESLERAWQVIAATAARER